MIYITGDTHIPIDINKLSSKRFFEDVNRKLKFDKWFFGHYHIDKNVDESHIAIYNSVIKA